MMTDQIQALCTDRLLQVTQNPDVPEFWHLLVAAVLALPQDLQPEWVTQVSAIASGSYREQWLKASALCFLSKDQLRWRALLELLDKRVGLEAGMQALQLIWLDSLKGSLGSKQMAERLDAVGTVAAQMKVAAMLVGGRPRIQSIAYLSAPRRIAIYTPQIASMRHGGTALTMHILGALAKLGCSLRVFTGQEPHVAMAEQLNGAGAYIIKQAMEAATLVINSSETFQVKVPDLKLSLGYRLAVTQKTLDDFDPDLVVFVGFLSPLACRLYERYPIVGLSIHAMPPIVPLDSWLAPLKNTPAQQTLPGLPEPVAIPFTQRFWPTPKPIALSRTSLGIAQKHTVLLTTGSRLTEEIKEPWLLFMLDFLNSRSDCCWVIVGVTAERVPNWATGRPAIHFVGPQLDLMPWIAMADIYVNPQRVGGGTTVANAMERGVPVLSFSDGDGGDKVGKFAVVDMESYFAQLANWVDKPKEREAVAAALQERFHAVFSLAHPSVEENLRLACMTAMQSFARRTRKSDA